MVLVFNLPSFWECPIRGIRIGLLICSLNRYLLANLCAGPDAGHTALNITDMALAFTDQTGPAGDQHDRTCCNCPTPGFQ